MWWQHHAVEMIFLSENRKDRQDDEAHFSDFIIKNVDHFPSSVLQYDISHKITINDIDLCGYNMILKLQWAL